MKILCGHCHGAGEIAVERAAGTTSAGPWHTVVEERRCYTCKGTGRLEIAEPRAPQAKQ